MVKERSLSGLVKTCEKFRNRCLCDFHADDKVTFYWYPPNLHSLSRCLRWKTFQHCPLTERLPKDDGCLWTFYEAIHQYSKHPQKYLVSLMQTKFASVFHPSPPPPHDCQPVMYGGDICTFGRVQRSMMLKGCLHPLWLIAHVPHKVSCRDLN